MGLPAFAAGVFGMSNKEEEDKQEQLANTATGSGVATYQGLSNYIPSLTQPLGTSSLTQTYYNPSQTMVVTGVNNSAGTITISNGSNVTYSGWVNSLGQSTTAWSPPKHYVNLGNETKYFKDKEEMDSYLTNYVNNLKFDGKMKSILEEE